MRTPVKGVAWLLPFMLTACYPQAASGSADPAPRAAHCGYSAAQPRAAACRPAASGRHGSEPDDDRLQPPPRPSRRNSPRSPRSTTRKPANKERRAGLQRNRRRSAPSASFLPAIPPINSARPTTSIASTEHGLNAITRKLNDQEQKTAAQIREFLKQAKAALASGDVDGAHTLALKAQVLLGEINQVSSPARSAAAAVIGLSALPNSACCAAPQRSRSRSAGPG